MITIDMPCKTKKKHKPNMKYILKMLMKRRKNSCYMQMNNQNTLLDYREIYKKYPTRIFDCFQTVAFHRGPVLQKVTKTHIMDSK